jgi:hypothetical protein
LYPLRDAVFSRMKAAKAGVKDMAGAVDMKTGEDMTGVEDIRGGKDRENGVKRIACF